MSSLEACLAWALTDHSVQLGALHTTSSLPLPKLKGTQQMMHMLFACMHAIKQNEASDYNDDHQKWPFRVGDQERVNKLWSN